MECAFAGRHVWVACALARVHRQASGHCALLSVPASGQRCLLGAASNVVATFCQYEALKYVSFPVQTLGKCAKMIPVMIWGTAVNGKSYKAKDYIVALLVTMGCVLFALTGALLSHDCLRLCVLFALTGALLSSLCAVRTHRC